MMDNDKFDDHFDSFFSMFPKIFGTMFVFILIMGLASFALVATAIYLLLKNFG